ncbi:DUF7146 domain-containing protein [Rhodovulum sp. DZ06]|uniref:DUF7146 domain-containing protein n=1 Tax=Rhodovulum sp. DZ06 TaxID=3425126 RepID=UPI003D35332A
MSVQFTLRADALPRADRPAAIHAGSAPVEGTPAERWLRRLGLDRPPPEALRWRWGRRSALVAPLTLPDDPKPRAILRVFLLSSGAESRCLPTTLLTGASEGCAIHLQDGDGPLILCSGLEDAIGRFNDVAGRAARLWAGLDDDHLAEIALPTTPGRLLLPARMEEGARRRLTRRAAAEGWRVSPLPRREGEDR